MPLAMVRAVCTCFTFSGSFFIISHQFLKLPIINYRITFTKIGRHIWNKSIIFANFFFQC